MESKEVLIIGGGIIGLASAYYLSRSGLSEEVLLIERDRNLVSHASGHNAGGIASARLFSTKEMSALFNETGELHIELSRDFDFDYRLRGSIVIQDEKEPPFEASQFDTLAREFRDECGGEVELLNNPKDINDKEPNLEAKKIRQALYYPKDSQGNSLKLGQCFAKTSSEKGTKIQTDAEVLGFESKDHAIESVTTKRGKIKPKTVVIAGGPWSGRIASLLGIDLPVKPVKGHLITTFGTKMTVLNSFVLGPNYYAMQIVGGIVVLGGGEDSVGFDSTVIASRSEEAWSEMASYIPVLNSLRQDTISTCFRPFASDGLPIIGRSSRYRNLIFSTGHFRNGFSLAPVTGKIVSELIGEGETNMNIAPFSPGRFRA